MPVLPNPKHERFAQEIAKGQTADAAYQLAGYKANRGNAIRLKNSAAVLARVDEIIGRGAERAEITVAQVLEAMGRIAFSDLRDIFNEDGSLKPIAEWPDGAALAIASVETDELFEGTGKERQRIGVTRKVKLWDKPRALEMLGRTLGMFKDKLEVRRPTDDMTDDELRACIDQLKSQLGR